MHVGSPDHLTISPSTASNAANPALMDLVSGFTAHLAGHDDSDIEFRPLGTSAAGTEVLAGLQQVVRNRQARQFHDLAREHVRALGPRRLSGRHAYQVNALGLAMIKLQQQIERETITERSIQRAIAAGDTEYFHDSLPSGAFGAELAQMRRPFYAAMQAAYGAHIKLVEPVALRLKVVTPTAPVLQDVYEYHRTAGEAAPHLTTFKSLVRARMGGEIDRPIAPETVLGVSRPEAATQDNEGVLVVLEGGREMALRLARMKAHLHEAVDTTVALTEAAAQALADDAAAAEPMAQPTP